MSEKKETKSELPQSNSKSHTNRRKKATGSIAKKINRRLKASLKEAKNAWELVQAIFDISEDPMVVLDKNSCIVIANTCYSTLMGIDLKHLKGMGFIPPLKKVLSQKEDLKTQLKTAMETNKDFISDMMDFETASGKKSYTIKGSILKKDKSFPYRILLQFLSEQSRTIK